LSVISLTLAATVGTETRSAQYLWDDLQSERLAKSGHELAAYLETKGLASPAEELTGLPVEPVVPDYSYRIRLEPGTVELFLEGENGKIDLSSADEQTAISFFSWWAVDRDRPRQITESLADWIDSDDSIRSFGAESSWYLASGYRPRNAGLGAADLFLIKGLTPADFFPSVVDSTEGVSVRPSLSRLMATTAIGNRINPNYAPRVVLESLPGMTSELLESILQIRMKSVFKNHEDFSARTGVSPQSPILNRLVFDRGSAPAIRSVAQFSTVRSERRTRTTIRPPGWRQGMPMRTALWLVERD
jgi:type II secretory pathway component PulK